MGFESGLRSFNLNKFCLPLGGIVLKFRYAVLMDRERDCGMNLDFDR